MRASNRLGAQLLSCGLLLGAASASWADFTVQPERTTTVVLSNRDVNRIVCEAGRVSDVFFSEEKGVVAQATKRDVFVKLKLKQRTDTGELVLPVLDVDLHIVCADEVYSLVGDLKPIPAQTIRLVPGAAKARRNVEAMRGMPEEKRIQKILLQAYRDTFPDSYTIETKNEPFATLGSGFVDLRRVVKVEGVGLAVRVYEYRASQTVTLDEREFLRPEFGTNIAAVSIDTASAQLAAGETARVFVIERTAP